MAQAIILYEAALGLGIAVGPLVGGVLGSISWRGPFFGVSALMAFALIVTAFLLPSTPRAEHATTLADPFRALRHRGLLGVAITALLYNFGFFTLLAFTPFPLDMSAHQIGLIFFGWGLALAFTSVVVAPRLQHRFGTVPTLLVNLLAMTATLVGDGRRHRQQGRVGDVCGRRGSVHRHQQHVDHRDRHEGRAGRTRSGLGGLQLRAVLRAPRWRPWLAGVLGEQISVHLPFWVGAAAVLLGAGVLFATRKHLVGIDVEESELDEITEQATAITVGSDS